MKLLCWLWRFFKGYVIKAGPGASTQAAAHCEQWTVSSTEGSTVAGHRWWPVKAGGLASFSHFHSFWFIWRDCFMVKQCFFSYTASISTWATWTHPGDSSAEKGTMGSQLDNMRNSSWAKQIRQELCQISGYFLVGLQWSYCYGGSISPSSPTLAASLGQHFSVKALVSVSSANGGIPFDTCCKGFLFQIC